MGPCDQIVVPEIAVRHFSYIGGSSAGRTSDGKKLLLLATKVLKLIFPRILCRLASTPNRRLDLPSFHYNSAFRRILSFRIAAGCSYSQSTYLSRIRMGKPQVRRGRGQSENLQRNVPDNALRSLSIKQQKFRNRKQ
jgi:hypothetical protein